VFERSIEVRNSRIHGRGVFAKRRIPKGKEIIRYKGKLITHEEADDQGPDDGHTFLFILNDDWVIDATHGGNDARWINHSCDPNCVPYVHEAPGKDRRKDKVIIEARRDIEPGEELGYDYRIEAVDPRDTVEASLWTCRCGAKKCRGTMLHQPRKKKKKAAKR
jgi:SET domain-containing protein